MDYFYLFIGSLTNKKISANTIENAYEKALEQFDFEEVELQSKSSTSIFFNASFNGIPCRCSVSDKSVINEDELED